MALSNPQVVETHSNKEANILKKIF